MLKKLTIVLLFISTLAFAQPLPSQYGFFIHQADSLYDIKQYKNSAFTYNKAFETIGRKGIANDRYNAACSWAMANYPDSAFYNLTILATKANYANFNHLVTDTDLEPLHNDPRWMELAKKVKANKDKLEEKFNHHLVTLIDSMEIEDQKWRKLIVQYYNHELDTIKYPSNMVRKNEILTDSLNYYLCKKIINQYGYPNHEMVGQATSHNFWLLIQHQDKCTSFQDTVLTLMKSEVDKGQASGSDYAYLIDRVKINAKQLQVYDTQMTVNKEGTSYEPPPVIDPEKLNERRKSVGLSPEEDYIRIMNTRYYGSLKK